MVVMDVSCFENETCGELVSGMELHQFLFDHVKRPAKIRNYILHPKVMMLGDQGAMIAYVRLTQFIDKSERPVHIRAEETRVYHKERGRWMMVHFHRSGGHNSLPVN
ncbi:calcium/calmodulin-dependent protein kinase type II subunit delta-like [Corticium candelabrum]|uniref:calcium/calmodulin-dependent protein kinase type II subunit delta-like n=1 Tax=Corticium candelabrum TaxID=121492 RepID=UPI002E260882|nr:calcium/calmodulin-dependent protein kinase type II subunit delta-like [Corticium candelabrum]